MAEEYEYYSDSSPERKSNNRNQDEAEDEDDEQHQQKRKSRVEQLEAKVHHLKHELTTLHHENEHLKKAHNFKQDVHTHHTNDIMPTNDGHIIKDHEHLSHEVVHLRHQIKDLEKKLHEHDKPTVPAPLVDAFSKLVAHFSWPCEVKKPEHQTAENYVQVIKHINRTVTQLIKSSENNMPSGSDSELAIKVKNLQDELRLALGAAEDIRALKGKLTQMIERVRIEKEGKCRADAEAAAFRKKTEMLSDHMEKLMAHLRHESATKLRLVKQLNEAEEMNRSLKQNYSVLLKKNATKDRFILEMHEGSKVLEDQLKLMDEKVSSCSLLCCISLSVCLHPGPLNSHCCLQYLNLRSKLDYAREWGSKKLARSERTASELRSKFTLLTGGNTLLDNVREDY